MIRTENEVLLVVGECALLSDTPIMVQHDFKHKKDSGYFNGRTMVSYIILTTIYFLALPCPTVSLQGLVVCGV